MDKDMEIRFNRQRNNQWTRVGAPETHRSSVTLKDGTVDSTCPNPGYQDGMHSPKFNRDVCPAYIEPHDEWPLSGKPGRGRLP